MRCCWNRQSQSPVNQSNLRCIDRVAASRPGCRGHRYLGRGRTAAAQEPMALSEMSFATATCCRLTGNIGIGHIRYPTAGGSRCGRSAAVLRQLTVWHLPWPQRQPDQLSDELSELLTKAGSAAPEHRFGLGSAAERVCPRTADLRANGAADAGQQIFACSRSRARSLQGRLRGRRIDCRRRCGCISRSERHPAARARRAAESSKRQRIHGSLGKRRARRAAVQAACATCSPAETVFIENSPASCIAGSDARQPHPAHALYFRVRLLCAARIRFSTTCRCTRPGCAWASSLPARSFSDFPDHDIDVVIPIPDTSRTSAVQVAHHLGTKYREGFIKNRYIGRTFIMPGQAERTQARSARNSMQSTWSFAARMFCSSTIPLFSGTTSRQIIKLAREAGARRVYFASAAPPVRYP